MILLLQMQAKLDLFLTGGGLKGAYQYGFCKQLYKRCPNISFNNVYGASIGSINSAPILLKHIDVLDWYWQNPEGLHPAQIMLHPRTSFNMPSLYSHINTFHFTKFWNGLSNKDRDIIKERLSIIAYDNMMKKPVLLQNILNDNDLIDAIKSSSNFPGLFSMKTKYLDGCIANQTEVLKQISHSNSADVLILDVFNTGDNHFTMSENKKNKIISYSPSCFKDEYLKEHVVSVYASIEDINILIENGKKDADHFIENYVF